MVLNIQWPGVLMRSYPIRNARDLSRNVLIVGQGYDHPLLFSQELTCNQLHWISEIPLETPFKCTAKTRYRQSDQHCIIDEISENSAHVAFKNPQRAITPGQSIVFYQEDVCLGGGIIE